MMQLLTIQRKMRVFLHFVVHRHYCSPRSVYKFNVLLTVQNLKNVGIVYTVNSLINGHAN